MSGDSLRGDASNPVVCSTARLAYRSPHGGGFQHGCFRIRQMRDGEHIATVDRGIIRVLSEESIRTGTSLTKSPGSVGFKTRFTDGDGIPSVVPSKLIAEATTTTVAGS